MHGYSKPRFTRTGLFLPLEIGLSPQFALLLQNSAQKPTHERLQHGGNKKGQHQISSDKKPNRKARSLSYSNAKPRAVCSG
jgi:hypothetical protein